MIGHDDESQSLRLAHDILVMKTPHRYACCDERSKNGLAGCGDDGHQIGMVGQGNAAFAEIFSVWLFFGVVHGEILS